jgi:hypothetical protein
LTSTILQQSAVKSQTHGDYHVPHDADDTEHLELHRSQHAQDRAGLADVLGSGHDHLEERSAAVGLGNLRYHHRGQSRDSGPGHQVTRGIILSMSPTSSSKTRGC